MEVNMTHQIHSSIVASITDLKKHPMATVESAKGHPLAILNRNQPAFYCLAPELYESILEALEETEIKEIISERSSEKEIFVSPDDL